ncbi:DUF3575 domain-containing protein [Xanthomarina sp. F2636L]|uniref:DUF3575 domain-containing protein n=1 Tax=Xanthomarina sp. F2636L TaxID=2996018 RepID=UPI00225DD93C|nr:DUF3575 domain-containing protein [Xanthomarina sp. F2636L]MCX7549699.1 DUF3575 domain-containing protein [Xanthomarina sp. F2636L]
MKRLSTCLVLLMVLISSTANSQEIEQSPQANLIKNEVSFEVLQLLNGVYQLSYERYIWNNFSGALALGYKGKEGIIKLSGIDTDQIKTEEVFYTGFQIAPEIRYYLKSTSKNNLDGFYFGAYLKYSNYKSNLAGAYMSDDGTTYDMEFDMKLDITSVGLMLGYKLAVTKHLNIDFMIAGPGSGRYNFHIENKKDLPEEFYDDLNEALEEYSILDFINSDFRFSEINNKSKFSAFSFRYGIAVGYTF